MTDRPFQRPGSSHEPQSELWPYHPPPVDPEPMLLSSASQRIAEPGSGIDDPPRTTASAVRWRGVRMVVAAAVGGFVLGGITTGLLSTVFFPTPEPVPVTVDAFPEHILGVEREDLSARSIGDVEALQQFDANFRDQIPRFQFAHGGPGAAVNYGQVLTLTIVDGYQSLPCPRAPGPVPRPVHRHSSRSNQTTSRASSSQPWVSMTAQSSTAQQISPQRGAPTACSTIHNATSVCASPAASRETRPARRMLTGAYLSACTSLSSPEANPPDSLSAVLPEAQRCCADNEWLLSCVSRPHVPC